ncbi:hypothetical protein OB236_23890 [Paenibacillus sp. WQ 127069]|uniref:RelA/SpoT domain-containing protein n=1 Tax=Paenibacillus baimaensis TaxID=2982185 RepID=A0ABT2UKI7_9BACL|nr:hypothetical protein [Paenibacillus sp. WQ 127069]MCU6795153.1 hypothetical protein [Paenibacillus sp. WQ 127069]
MEIEKFLTKYRITIEEFNKTGLVCEELLEIFNDFEAKKDQYESMGKSISEKLRKDPKVHSIKYRVKDSEHLVEKIIRKRIEKPKRIIDLKNYQKEITDLVGVRAIHLFKSDWIDIDNYIMKHWNLHEKNPTLYYREGDFNIKNIPAEYKKCVVKPHPYGYRSVHYTIKSKHFKEETIAEIQVRTIFEEGWSEIDHNIRYPYDKDNPILNPYIQIFNRFAGSADEMGTYLNFLKDNIDGIHVSYQNELEDKNQSIKDLEIKINQNKKLDDEEKLVLLDEIQTLREKINNSSDSISFEKIVQGKLFPFKHLNQNNATGSDIVFSVGPDSFITVQAKALRNINKNKSE